MDEPVTIVMGAALLLVAVLLLVVLHHVFLKKETTTKATPEQIVVEALKRRFRAHFLGGVFFGSLLTAVLFIVLFGLWR